MEASPHREKAGRGGRGNPVETPPSRPLYAMNTPNGMTLAARLASTPEGGVSAADLLRLFLSRKSELTAQSYRYDLQHFARFYGVEEDVPKAVEGLLSLAGGRGNALLLAYQTAMMDQGFAPATINRRMVAIRSLMRTARMVGVTHWTPVTDSLPVAPYRDTAGPGPDAVRRVLDSLGDSRRDVRNRAIILLMACMGLRIGEVVSLDLAHYQHRQRRLMVKGKGKLEREPVTVQHGARSSLRAWVRLRGRKDGPLFTRLTRTGVHPHLARLDRQGMYRAVVDSGKRAGVRLNPHGLRHTAVTAILDSGATTRMAQKFARHTSPATTQVYDDNRADLAGEGARILDRLYCGD